MKQTYLSPELAEHGSIAALTGLFGSQQIQDVLVNPAGAVVQSGTGSLDACPTQQRPSPGQRCVINGG